MPLNNHLSRLDEGEADGEADKADGGGDHPGTAVDERRSSRVTALREGSARARNAAGGRGTRAVGDHAAVVNRGGGGGGIFNRARVDSDGLVRELNASEVASGIGPRVELGGVVVDDLDALDVHGERHLGEISVTTGPYMMLASNTTY